MCCFLVAFLSEEMADEESDIFRNLFGDIIQTYEVYDFIPTRETSFRALTHTDEEYKKFLDEWIPPFLGRRNQKCCLIDSEPPVSKLFFETYTFIDHVMNAQSQSHQKVQYFCTLFSFDCFMNLFY